MANDLFNLVVNTPDGAASYFHLNADRVRIGRGSENHIIVVEDPVSTKHCELIRHEGQFYLVDLDSKNGTHLNGSPASSDALPLKNGDQIVLGRTVKIQFVRVYEVSGKSSEIGEGEGVVTRKLAKSPPKKKKEASASPSINPVAAAVARATRGLPKGE